MNTPVGWARPPSLKFSFFAFSCNRRCSSRTVHRNEGTFARQVAVKSSRQLLPEIPMRHLVALVAALGGCVGLVLAAQAPAPPPLTPQFRAGIDVVQVDVSVLDKDRRPVTGLTQADFVVLENGKPQPIVAFSPVDIPGAPDVVVGDAPWTREFASDVASNEAATKRIVVIVIDDAFMPADPATMKNAKQIA